MEHVAEQLLAALIGAWLGSFFGSYLKKKGENIATHEDVQKLVDQMAAVTAATKSIEAQISNDVWDRQRQWELKRDALFDVVRELGNIIEALTLLDSCYRARSESENPDASPWLDRQSEALEAWSAASKSFSGATLLAELVCGPKVKAALGEANSATRRIAADVFQGNNDAFRKSIPLVLGVRHMVVQSIREELRLHPFTTFERPSQSTGELSTESRRT